MWKNKSTIIAGLIGLLVLILLNAQFKPVLIGGKIIFVEIADNLNERAQGLKGRKFLAENKGMLFCFEREVYPQFWMKDTLIPLDIAFISMDNKIVDIQHMLAFDDKLRYVPKTKVIYALEMNSGWFERNKVDIGDKLFCLNKSIKEKN
ncbi:MAG: DUF192 domain-containing protein [Candidatus Omnitrophica bacterium]|nr:DUF192 domain-containing protein [Candidatus Omnitrophota bacterium]